MKTKTIKELYDLIGSPFIFDTTLTYPTIQGNTSNFLSDYAANQADLDGYFLKEYGKRLVDFDSDTDEDIEDEWEDMLRGILKIYLKSWARLYYTLNINYNPVYNVEEHITNTYGQHETETEYGQDVNTNVKGQTVMTDVYGQQQRTDGQRTDTRTDYSVSADAVTEKETGKSENVAGEQVTTDATYTDTHTGSQATDTNTRDEHTDTTTSKQHIDQTDREGNIGVVAAIDLIKAEERFRRNYAFFKNCFLTISEEIGAYYESVFI